MLGEWQRQFPAEADVAALAHADPAPLAEPRELALAARLGDFSDALAAAADELAPHQVAFYLRELAGEFHSYYNAVHVLVPEQPSRRARLALSAAVRQVLANGLRLLGVSAPERM
jgi:arginyl-tRNA synthetase